MKYNNNISRNICHVLLFAAADVVHTTLILMGCSNNTATSSCVVAAFTATATATAAFPSTISMVTTKRVGSTLSTTKRTTRFLQWKRYSSLGHPIKVRRLYSKSTGSSDIETTDWTTTGNIPLPVEEIVVVDDNNDDNDQQQQQQVPTQTTASIGTVNERLLAELQAATALEQSGGSRRDNNNNNKSNKWSTAASFFQSSKTDDERRAAIAEAQNLNGVEPISTLFGGLFAIGCAIGLWFITQSLASYFALHPSESDVYFVERVTLLSRNIIMGLSALASGFFGVTGIGILLLSIRVGYGVVTGELDPTPIVSKNHPADTTTTTTTTKVDMRNVWDMMMNKSPKKGPR